MRAYHFVGDTLRDGRPIPPDGEWLVFDGEPIMCERGLHASLHPFDALQYAPGDTLCLVECEDVTDQGGDKIVCRRRKIIARFDATDLMREFARKCALDVVHLWDAPAVVREYLETGNESLIDAASAAARAAAWAAAWDAAWAAASAAAWAAASAADWAAASAAASAAARDAARAAAWDAAWDPAWDPARAAARAAQKLRFANLVDAKFGELT